MAEDLVIRPSRALKSHDEDDDIVIIAIFLYLHYSQQFYLQRDLRMMAKNVSVTGLL